MPPHWLQKCLIRWLNKRSVLVEKNIWRYKKLQGRIKPIRAQKPIRKSKKSGDLFLLFLETVKLL